MTPVCTHVLQVDDFIVAPFDFLAKKKVTLFLSREILVPQIQYGPEYIMQ